MVLTFAFYTLVLYCFVVELTSVFKPGKAFQDAQTINEHLKADDRLGKLSKGLQAHYWNQILYWAVCLTGIMSSQWPVFILIIFISSIHNLWRKSVFLHWVDSVICGALLLLAVLNRFHFHVNLEAWLAQAVGL